MVILAIPVLLSYLQSLTGPISTSLLMICLSERGCCWLEFEFEEDLVAVEINKLEIISRLPSKGEIYFGGGWNFGVFSAAKNFSLDNCRSLERSQLTRPEKAGLMIEEFFKLLKFHSGL